MTACFCSEQGRPAGRLFTLEQTKRRWQIAKKLFGYEGGRNLMK